VLGEIGAGPVRAVGISIPGPLWGDAVVATNHTTTPTGITTAIGKFNDEQLHQHRQPE